MQTLSFMHLTCNFICGLSDVIIKTFSSVGLCRMRYVCVMISRLQSPQSCWSYVASLHAKTRSCFSQHADAAADSVSVVSAFIPLQPRSLWLPGIHMPPRHPARPPHPLPVMRFVVATRAVPSMKPEATALGNPQDGRWKITLTFDGRRFCIPKLRSSTLQRGL